MAKMYPNYFAHDISDGEKDVFRRFAQDQVYTKDWIVLHSFNISRHIKHNHNGEADFVILIPNKGVLILEVKAHGEVMYNQKTGWCLGKGEKKDTRNPIEQAKNNMFSIKKSYIDQYDKNILIDWAVVFTHVDSIQDSLGGGGVLPISCHFHL